MTLPNSKHLSTIAISAFILMIALGIIGDIFDAELIGYFDNKIQAALVSKLTFLALGTLFAIALFPLFIRHFPRYASKVVATSRPSWSHKIDQFILSGIFEVVASVFAAIIFVGAVYVAYIIIKQS